MLENETTQNLININFIIIASLIITYFYNPLRSFIGDQTSSFFANTQTSDPYNDPKKYFPDSSDSSNPSYNQYNGVLHQQPKNANINPSIPQYAAQYNTQGQVPQHYKDYENISEKAKSNSKADRHEARKAARLAAMSKMPDIPTYTNDNIPTKPKVLYNPNFIFHTKQPKAGSTTMHSILQRLSRLNNFYYIKMNPHEIKDDSFRAAEPLAKWYNLTKSRIASRVPANVAEEERMKKLVLLKHHYPFDWSEFGVENPTYINVIREPVSWFQSHYYFERNGWSMVQGDRNSFKGTEADRLRTINQCINGHFPDCVECKWTYLNFISGQPKGYRAKALSKQFMSQYAKHMLLNRFFVVGILEEFDKSMDLFQAMMPDIFTHAKSVAHSPAVTGTQNNTKSVKNEKLTEANKLIVKQKILPYESDFYEFAKAIFHQQLSEFGVQ